jgi:hypothetical protein
VKTNIKNHLTKQTPCNPINKNITREEALKLFYPVKQYACKYCDKAYKGERYLLKHIQTIHPEKLNKEYVKPVITFNNEDLSKINSSFFKEECKKDIQNGLKKVFREVYIKNNRVLKIGCKEKQTILFYEGDEKWIEYHMIDAGVKVITRLLDILGTTQDITEDDRKKVINFIYTTLRFNQ